jgi:hypothetical protein
MPALIRRTSNSVTVAHLISLQSFGCFKIKRIKTAHKAAIQ